MHEHFGSLKQKPYQKFNKNFINFEKPQKISKNPKNFQKTPKVRLECMECMIKR